MNPLHGEIAERAGHKCEYCRAPEDAFNFCRDALACFDRRGCSDDPPKREWINAEKAVEELIKARPDDAAHVFAHLLYHLGLLEHGVSVGGSWLTDDGTRIVDMEPATQELMDEE